MKTKMKQIRNLTTQELRDRLNEAREELMKLRFRQATGELTDTSQIRITRRSVARLTALLEERQRTEQLEGEK
jgi:large subunit ribosomal protein L29